MPPAAGERTQLHVRQYFPEEIQKQILSNLTNPATIVRFSCVSNSWRRLLSEDLELIAKILFSDDDIKGKEAHVLTTAAPGLTTPYSVHSYDTLPPVSSGNLPASDAWPVVHIAGCSNGIFCITDTYHTGTICLWNPTTSETKVLPPPPSPEFDSHLTEVGFGFDPVTEDYKVIILFCNFTSSHLIYLYNLRKNSWKRLRDSGSSSGHVPFISGQSVGLAASRAPKYSKCHWFGIASDHHFIFTTFDMSKEAFTQLNLPMLPIKRSAKPTFHIVKDGPCLAAVYSGIRPEDTPVSSFLKVWAALDYEALAREECSWMMMYDVDCREPIAAPPGQSASGNWVHGKFFVEWTMATNRETGRVYTETTNGVVDHKVKNGQYIERVAYLPSTMSMAAQFRGRRRRSIIGRAIDCCASIFRRVFLRRRLCED